jgi:hypothetical protein
MRRRVRRLWEAKNKSTLNGFVPNGVLIPYSDSARMPSEPPGGRNVTYVTLRSPISRHEKSLPASNLPKGGGISAPHLRQALARAALQGLKPGDLASF